MLENKDDSIVDLLDTMLTKWEEGEGAGARVDRFLLYYRGHGVQVSGQPCLLTPDWDTIPILELVNKIAELVIADRYYIVTDCCANRRDLWDEDGEEIIAKQRVEKADNAQQHKTQGERIVNISAGPGGYKANEEEDKTLTSVHSGDHVEGHSFGWSTGETAWKAEQAKQLKLPSCHRLPQF